VTALLGPKHNRFFTLVETLKLLVEKDLGFPSLEKQKAQEVWIEEVKTQGSVWLLSTTEASGENLQVL
jgi:hypothetical protein